MFRLHPYAHSAAVAAFFCLCGALSLTPELRGQGVRARTPGQRVIVTVPMTGSGTWEDPKRPDLPKGEAIEFHYVLSDDGQTAIAEVTLSSPLELSKLQAALDRNGKSRLYHPAIDKFKDVELEIKKLKANFNADTLNPANARKGEK